MQSLQSHQHHITSGHIQLYRKREKKEKVKTQTNENTDESREQKLSEREEKAYVFHMDRRT